MNGALKHHKQKVLSVREMEITVTAVRNVLNKKPQFPLKELKEYLQHTKLVGTIQDNSKWNHTNIYPMSGVDRP